MSLITSCPACGTMFRVVRDQLKISEGWVRCGHCAEVFDATAHLSDESILGGARRGANRATRPGGPAVRRRRRPGAHDAAGARAACGCAALRAATPAASRRERRGRGAPASSPRQPVAGAVAAGHALRVPPLRPGAAGADSSMLPLRPGGDSQAAADLEGDEEPRAAAARRLLRAAGAAQGVLAPPAGAHRRSRWRACCSPRCSLQVAYQDRDRLAQAQPALRPLLAQHVRRCSTARSAAAADRGHRHRELRLQPRCAATPTGSQLHAAQHRRACRVAMPAHGAHAHRRAGPADRCAACCTPQELGAHRQRDRAPAASGRGAVGLAVDASRQRAHRRLPAARLLSLNHQKDFHGSRHLRIPRLRHHHDLRGPLRRADPAGPAAHPERVLPGAGAAARLRRLRRQHRLQPQAAGRHAAADGRGRQRRRRLPAAAASSWASAREFVRAGGRTPTRRRR